LGRVSVLQLDTKFLRIPGDIGCEETFVEPPQYLVVKDATVREVVTSEPQNIDIGPFLEAAKSATGDILTTSCGFLAPFQKEIQESLDIPVVVSSISQLSEIEKIYSPEQLLILTIAADKLCAKHLPEEYKKYSECICGLGKSSYLHKVIYEDMMIFDEEKVADELLTVFKEACNDNTDALLLECTNMPPYKQDLKQFKPVKIFDILSAIEALLPNTVKPTYL
jgi:hypothetical protein